MKQLSILCAVLAWTLSAGAEETNVKVPVPEGFQTLQMEQMPTAPGGPAKKVKFSASCVDNNGRTLQQNEPGYDSCLSQVKLKSLNPDNTKGSGTGAPGPQMNINFNSGN